MNYPDIILTACPFIVTVSGFSVVSAHMYDGRPISTPCVNESDCGASSVCVKTASQSRRRAARRRVFGDALGIREHRKLVAAKRRVSENVID